MIKKAIILSFISTVVSLCFLLFFVLEALIASKTSFDLLTFNSDTRFNSVLMVIPGLMILISLLISNYVQKNNIKLDGQEKLWLSFPFIYAGLYISTIAWFFFR